MKTINKISLLLVLCGIVLLNTTCEKDLFTKITYEGYVYNSSNQPQSGVIIDLKACGGGTGDKQPYGCQDPLIEIGTSTTDVSGHFYIHERAASTGWYYPLWNGNWVTGNSSTGIAASQLNQTQYTIIHI
jgi:hypothetical protein